MFVLVVPFAASIAFAFTLSVLLPTVSTAPEAIVRWLLIAVVSTSVMVAFDRVTRRLLPLSSLLSLTLAFPDQAPSRFKVAMRTGTTLQLQRVVADARAGRIGSTPAEAAEKLLELVAALSLHDRLTRGHAERVRAYTHMVGEELKITGAELEHLRWSALLHDIGKLLVSTEILNKPGELNEREFEAIKKHPEFGRDLVAPLVEWLGDSSRAVWEHHEHWDGTGYPRGLSGTEIGLAARVIAVTDAFDVMTSARSYKEPISPVAARSELAFCAGSHFDEVVVRAFLNVSLGRLRMAMGPLSWLTQLSFVPKALVSSGASGATAITAVVGLAAGALGVGLDDNGVTSAAGTEQSATPTTPVPSTFTTPPRSAATSTAPTTTTVPAQPSTVPLTSMMSDNVFYLLSPGPGDVPSQAVLQLGIELPPELALVPNYDTDRDDEPGLTLEHASDSRREQRFRWDTAQTIHLRGAITVQLHATGRNNSGPFTLDVRMRSCRGADCTDIANRRESTISPEQGFASITFDLGPIDAVLAAGDALELLITVPTESASDVWLAYGATVAASRFNFVQI